MKKYILLLLAILLVSGCNASDTKKKDNPSLQLLASGLDDEYGVIPVKNDWYDFYVLDINPVFFAVENEGEVPADFDFLVKGDYAVEYLVIPDMTPELYKSLPETEFSFLKDLNGYFKGLQGKLSDGITVTDSLIKVSKGRNNERKYFALIFDTKETLHLSIKLEYNNAQTHTDQYGNTMYSNKKYPSLFNFVYASCEGEYIEGENFDLYGDLSLHVNTKIINDEESAETEQTEKVAKNVKAKLSFKEFDNNSVSYKFKLVEENDGSLSEIEDIELSFNVGTRLLINSVNVNDNPIDYHYDPVIGLLKVNTKETGTIKVNLDDPGNYLYVSNTDELLYALQIVQKGEVIVMAPGKYKTYESLRVPTGVTLIGPKVGVNGTDYKNLDDCELAVIKPSEYVDRVFDLTDSEFVKIDGIKLDCSGYSLKGIYGESTDDNYLKGIEISNLDIEDCGNDAIELFNSEDALITGNYIHNTYDDCIHLVNYRNVNGAVISNNVIRDNYNTINGGIAVKEGTGNVLIDSNKLSKIRSGHEYQEYEYGVAESAIAVDKANESGIITISNNEISDCEQGIGIYKFSSKTSKDKVIVINNKVTDYKTFAVATGSLNYDKLKKTVVEIKDNEFSEGNDPMLIEKTNCYGETTKKYKVICKNNSLNGEKIKDKTTRR